MLYFYRTHYLSIQALVKEFIAFHQKKYLCLQSNPTALMSLKMNSLLTLTYLGFCREVLFSKPQEGYFLFPKGKVKGTSQLLSAGHLANTALLTHS